MSGKPGHMSKASDGRKQTRKRGKKRLRGEASSLPRQSDGHSDHATDMSPPAPKRPKTTASSGDSTSVQGLDGPQANTTALPQIKPAGIPVSLGAAHEMVDINVISSTQIKSKVSKILGILSDAPATPTQPVVVSIHAKGPVASKLITIVEITKRELTKAGKRWYQYSSLSQTMEEKKRSGSIKVQRFPEDQNSSTEGRAVGVDDGLQEQDAEGIEEESYFETMKTPIERALEGKPKVRAAPVMTIYLSRIPIDSLERSYGEQTNNIV